MEAPDGRNATGEPTMSLIRLTDDRPLIEANRWAHIADDAPLPVGAAATVSLERWKAEREALSARNAPVGVRLRSDQRVEEIAEDLPDLPMIALEFPTLVDGRPFTSARLLRERHGYRGEVRATGAVLRDQLFFMARCGFDSFELPDDKDPESARRAFSELSVVYQPAADHRIPAPARRMRAHCAPAAG